MNNSTRPGRLALRLAVLLIAVTAASCGIEKQGAPGLSGPSEFATSITLTAAPDVLNRDGASSSTITLVARDTSNAPIAGLPLNLSLEPANGGTLSADQVVTGADGRVTFVFTAPSLSTPVNSVVIGATPIGNNFVNAVTRQVAVALAGPASATPSFTVMPAAPQRFQTTTLDASATTLNGQACGSNCSYSWAIGTEATLTGQTVTYQFKQQQTYAVVLTVTAPAGVQTTSQQSVTVSAATNPVAIFTFSPTNARVGDTVSFNGLSSTAANGATIVEYTWDFGDGATASGASQSHAFALVRTYVVRLTVRDSNGLTATTTQNVTVAAP